MFTIIVTGTPGTGKTTLAKRLAKKLDFHYLDVNDIIKKYDIADDYDKKRDTKIINTKKLNLVLIKEINNYKNSIKKLTIKKSSMLNSNERISIIKNNNNKSKNTKNGIIIDSHLSHYLPKRHVDVCIVTKCDLKELEKRLKSKKYSKDKIRENLDSEIFDVCLSESKEKGHKVIVVDTTKGININEVHKRIGL